MLLERFDPFLELSRQEFAEKSVGGQSLSKGSEGGFDRPQSLFQNLMAGRILSPHLPQKGGELPVALLVWKPHNYRPAGGQHRLARPRALCPAVELVM